MSRKKEQPRAYISPVQRKACIVLACCAVAIIVTFLLSWIVPRKLKAGLGSTDSYDPNLYPVDTTLGAVLTKTSEAGSDYVSSSVFVGDQITASLKVSNEITLNQYMAKSGLQIAQLLRESCIYFVDDANAYTIPQAISKVKPRRVILTMGSNDVNADTNPDAFIQDYRQVLQAIKSAYPYTDLIVNNIPPVSRSSENAPARQQWIDQLNQALAKMCDELGYKYLNSAEALKNSSGYGEDVYFNADNTYTSAGVNLFLSYVKTHVYETSDQRPDTNDIPLRAEQAAAAGDEPTPTPEKLTASYGIAKGEEGRGTLTGNGKSGVTAIEFEVESGANVAVTAVASEGYVFYKWSDGVTEATRYDNIKADLSVTAMFNDARVSLELDRGDTTMKVGESITVNATVKLGNKPYDNSTVQWAVNDELMMNGSTYTFTPADAGTYTIRAGVEINGNLVRKEITVTVAAKEEPTAISIAGTTPITAGNTVTLSATVQNPKGDTTWACDETAWKATGNQVQFTANEAGTYHIRAYNNGVEAQFTLVVNPAPTPTPTAAPTPSPTPSPTETPTPTDNSGQQVDEGGSGGE